MTEEDVDFFLLKRAKKVRTQRSLAMIIARRGLEPEGFKNIVPYLFEHLSKIELIPQEDYIFWFYIFLAE